jgi:DNA primase
MVLMREVNLEELKASHPLSSIVGQVTSLRRQGREFVGRCPFRHHQDRTPSFSVNDDKGVFLCRGCGETGDVITFVMTYEGVGFCEAIEIIAGSSNLGPCTPPPVAEVAKVGAYDRDRSDWARQIWKAAGPVKGTIGQKYLHRRGLDLELLPPDLPLRFGWFPCKGLQGECPTLVAAFTDLSGNVASIQRIFLTRDGQKISSEHPGIPAKQCLGSSLGAAVKLTAGHNHIIIAESVEDGLTLAQEVQGSTVWAVAGAGKIPGVVLPEACRSITIAPDNDRAGRAAADRAEPLFRMQGKAVASAFPPHPYIDWNEQLIAEKHA